MIIVEGPDGGGKSTLVQALAKGLNYPVAQRVVDKQTNALVDLQNWVDTNLMEGFSRTIYDRHRLISEPIYGPLIRPGKNLDFFSPMWLERVMGEFYYIRPVVIYCIPPRYVVKQNLAGDEDNAVPAPHIDAIYDMYLARACVDMAQSGRMYVHRYDYTSGADVDDIANWVGGYTEYRMGSA